MSTTRQTTMITAAGTADSPDRHGCPGVHRVHGEEGLIVIGKTNVSDTARMALADLVADDETPVRVQTWVPGCLMDLPTLSEFFYAHVHQPGDHLFRIERLPAYSVGEPLYDRWRNGQDIDWSLKTEWLDELRADHTNGIRHSRIRVFPAELTDYQRYACEWGYALNADAGEDIRVLREGEHDIPTDLIEAEYWLVNDEIAVPTLYDGRGRFLGAGWLDPERSAEYLDDRDRAWAAAEPFGEWWARHPELHRSKRKAA